MRNINIENLRMKVNVLEELVCFDSLASETSVRELKKIRKNLDRYFNL